MEPADALLLRALIVKEKKKVLKHRYTKGKNVLHIACTLNDIESVKMLLKLNADPNEMDADKQNSLHFCCQQGNLAIINLILPRITNITSKTNDENTALHFFVVHHPDADALTEYYRILERLKTSGADINKRNSKGETPLHLACSNSADTSAMWLIRQGADVSVVTKNGETALHYAALYGSEKLVSILVRAGGRSDRSYSTVTPRESAARAGRMEVVKLLDELSNDSSIGDETIVLNGSEVTQEQLKERKDVCSRVVEELFKNNSDSVRPSAKVRLKDKIHNACFTLSVVDTNIKLFSDEKADSALTGILRVGDPGQDTESWKSHYYEIDVKSEKFKIFPSTTKEENEQQPSKLLPLSTNLSFQLYFSDTCRFSIIYHRNPSDHIEHFAVPSGSSVFLLLKPLVLLSHKPIEFIEGKPLLPLLQKLDNKDTSTDLQTKATKKRKSWDISKTSRILHSAATGPKSSRRRSAKETSAKGQNILQRASCGSEFSNARVSVEGYIICDTNFASFMFQDVFSSQLELLHENDPVLDEYTLKGGTIRDLLNFNILHSNPQMFEGNMDLQAFYMSYYRYCEPAEIIKEINELWPLHSATFWPPPYNEVKSDTRLFNFVEGFIRSPFVLEASDVELQFRADLVDIYGTLVPSPSDPENTVSKLKGLLQKVKKNKEQVSINQSCDLRTLLGINTETEKKDLPFDIVKIDTDVLVSQIVCINADLYQQIQIKELLDLRFQDNDLLARSLNKVLDFSNKMHLLVPTTILQLNDPYSQKLVLKKWITIACKLFQLQDYNSSIQIANGAADISVMRLKHLKHCLSNKWMEKLDNIRETFTPLGNFANYRNLPKEPPCIPFIGVALKDLIFAYEGNPDRTDKNGINFHKMRVIADIFRALKIEKPDQLDFSYLEFDPQVTQTLLAATPLSQNDLYEKSKKISESLIATSDTCEDVPLLRKEIKQLRDEVHKLQKENDKKDKKISKLKLAALGTSVPVTEKGNSVTHSPDPVTKKSRSHSKSLVFNSQSPVRRRSTTVESTNLAPKKVITTKKISAPDVPPLELVPVEYEPRAQTPSNQDVDLKKLLELVRMQQFEIKKLKAQLEISRM